MRNGDRSWREETDGFQKIGGLGRAEFELAARRVAQPDRERVQQRPCDVEPSTVRRGQRARAAVLDVAGER